MSNTYRKDRKGEIYKESLKKKHARFKCRCNYCLSKKDKADKIAEKELETEVKRHIEEGIDCDIPEQDEILRQIMGRD
jgi:hypothetical protein